MVAVWSGNRKKINSEFYNILELKTYKLESVTLEFQDQFNFKLIQFNFL